MGNFTYHYPLPMRLKIIDTLPKVSKQNFYKNATHHSLSNPAATEFY
jgi:hypothetical protein